MNCVWEIEPIGNVILSLVVIVLVYSLIGLVFSRIARRKAAYIFLSVSFVFVITCYLFYLTGALIVTSGVSAAVFSLCLISNVGDLRSFVANPFSRSSAKAANFGIEKIYDSQLLYKNIETAVISLSKGRVGALITFEKNTSLKDIIKNGVPVHAPVTPELLSTIFYPGTRLHDGAVVVHGNEIVAASVFFTPTTKPFAGKYGSRHRAAIGISEISDAITIVVSEETGRISFAVNGTLESVDQKNFLRVFENYMSDASNDD